MRNQKSQWLQKSLKLQKGCEGNGTDDEWKQALPNTTLARYDPYRIRPHTLRPQLLQQQYCCNAQGGTAGGEQPVTPGHAQAAKQHRAYQ